MKTDKPKYLIIDVDGVMTTGQFLYSIEGKEYKIFGAHDNDGLKMLKDKIKIIFVTADKRGYQISKKRIVDDMGQELYLIGEQDRYKYIDTNYGFSNTIYIGDGIFDAKILKACLFGIAPLNARIEARNAANYITNSKSGEGAVLDACLLINEKYFNN